MQREDTVHTYDDCSDKLEDRPQNALNILEEMKGHYFDIFKKITDYFRFLIAGKISVYTFCTASNTFIALVWTVMLHLFSSFKRDLKTHNIAC